MYRRWLHTIINFFILVLGFSVKPFAQSEPNYIQITRQQGLQSNQIYATHIAKNGLLYIAHSKGLSSFDGSVFKNYYNHYLPFTEVSNIMETDDGTILCKAFNNNVFKVDHDTLKHLKWFPNPMGFSPSSVYQNTLIAMSNDSIVFYNTINNTQRSISIKSLKKTVLPKKVVFGGLYYHDKITSLVVVDSTLQGYLWFGNTSSNLHFSAGQLFLNEEKKMDRMIHVNKQKPISIPSVKKNTIVNYVATIDNAIWVCTTNGLYRQNENGSIEQILSKHNVSNIVCAQDQTYIVSTLDEGLFIIPDLRVDRLQISSETLTNLSGNQQNLLATTESGQLINYNLTTKQPITLTELTASKKPIKIIVDSGTNTIILSGEQSYFLKQNQVAQLPIVIKDYCYTKNGILLATNGGLYYYTKENKLPSWWMKHSVLVQRAGGYLYKLSYFSLPVFSVKIDEPNHTIFCNTYDGILQITANDSLPQLLPEPFCVLSEMIVYDNHVLLLTKDKGILEWNGKSYNPACNNTVPKGIFYRAEVFNKQLWVLAEDALYRYDGTHWNRYDHRYGIETNDIQGFYAIGEDVYLNNQKHIIHFPASIATQKQLAPQFIWMPCYSEPNHELLRNNQQLSFRNNSLLFAFNVISYRNGRNTHVAYSINDEALIHLPFNARQVQLNHLNPNDYTLKFYVYEDNRQTGVVSSFHFTIHPPFYKTWWFTTILLVLVAAIIGMISRRILFRWKKEARLIQGKLILERELDKSILSSIKAQMNPHFLFNALNTIQSYIYMNDKKNASVYISKFSDLTRSILDMSNRESITLEEEIRSLTLYLDLEKMRFEDSFDYHIHLDESIKAEIVRLPSMLIQPYVENAIKHGLLHKKNNRRLRITFKKKDAQLEIQIDDNGIGRKRSSELNEIKQRQHKSFAMDANKKRLEILKTNFKQINFEIIDKHSDLGEPTGTLVIIRLPL